MIQGVSKKVKCEICGQEMFARGLTGHRRMKHKVVVETITRVISDLPVTQAGTESLQVNNSSKSQEFTQVDLSKMIRVVEKVVMYKSVDLVPGHRGGKVVTTAFGYFMNQLDAHVAAGKNSMKVESDDISVDDILGRNKK